MSPLIGGVEAPPGESFSSRSLVVLAENAASRLTNLKEVGDIVHHELALGTETQLLNFI